jgi:subtilisin family serine protease
VTKSAVRLPVLALATALALAFLSATSPASAEWDGEVIPVDPPVGAIVAGSYIVSLDEGTDAANLADDAGVSPRFIYSTALDGFAAKLTPAQLSDLQRTPGVATIEHDQVYRTDSEAQATQTVAADGGLYGLDRIDQRNLPLSGTYTTAAPAGSVYAYVVDELIDTSHPDFGGRASNVFSVVGTASSPLATCADHGTHVAGTIGGTTYGVAKNVQLRGVRVLDCAGAGSVSGIIEAVDWIRSHAERPAVANLSVGGDHSPALNAAVTSLVQSGVSVAVAAGNEKADACATSPASAAGVMTVAASTKADAAASSFSNWGRCVDIYAPGVGITSTAPGGRTASMSGTSMASPHVAGAMALQKASGERRSSQVNRWLIRHATVRVVTSNPLGTPNRLLYVEGQ